MDVCRYSVKVNSQAGKIWVYVMTVRKAARYSAWCLKNLVADFRSRREHCWGYVSLSFRIHPKSFEIHFPLKAVGTLLSGSRKGAVGA